MARLLTCGFEVGNFTGETSDLGGLITGGSTIPTYSTGQVRSGGAAILVSGGSSGAGSNYISAADLIPVSSGVTYYGRVAVYPSTVATTNDQCVMSLVDTANAKGARLILTSSSLAVYDRSTGSSVATGTAVGTGAWHILEMAFTPYTGAFVVRVDGVQSFTGSVTNLSASTTMTYFLMEVPTGTCTLYADDIALNDNTGSNQNSWCGQGQVVLLKPIGDSSTTGFEAGTSSSSNLYDAVDNTPPIGKARASATTTSQITDNANNATDNYIAILQSYTGAGIPGGATIVLAEGIASMGNSSTTSRTNGLQVLTNPTIAETTGATTTTAAGTYPTGWTPLNTAYSYTPSVSLTSNPTIEFRKGTASTDYSMASLMGLLVEYGPVTISNLTASLGFSGTESRTISAMLGSVLSFTGNLAKSFALTLVSMLVMGFEASTYDSSSTGSLGFSGSLTPGVVFVSNLAGSLGFSGSLTLPTFAQYMTATLGFVAPSNPLQSLTGSLGFMGSLTKAITRSPFTGSIEFGFHNHYTQLLNATLIFGQHSWVQNLTAGLGFTGDFAANKAVQLMLFASNLNFSGALASSEITTVINQMLTGGLSFAGSLVQERAQKLMLMVSNLGFVGSMFTSGSLSHVFTATLSFTGTASRSTWARLGGALSFAGRISRSIGATLFSGASFVGATAKKGTRSLTGTSSFTGGFTPRPNKNLSGQLSFSGSYLRAIISLLTSSLTFIGRIPKRLTRLLPGSGLSFAAAFTAAGAAFVQQFAADLGFAAAARRTALRQWVAQLPFTGAVSRATSRPLPGVLGFTGGIRRSVTQALSAAFSFAGSVAAISGNALYKSFTASVGFTGTFGRGFVVVMASALSFATGFINRIPDLILTVLTAMKIVNRSSTTTQTYQVNPQTVVRQVEETAPGSITVYALPPE